MNTSPNMNGIDTRSPTDTSMLLAEAILELVKVMGRIEQKLDAVIEASNTLEEDE